MEPGKAGRVMIVEDDASIRALLRDHLLLAGFTIDEVGDGRHALENARKDPYQLIILDVMLPHLDGVTLCRTIRSESTNRETPILMLTARDAESDKILGLESGADDYLTKPFGVRELMARVGAILRRVRPVREVEAVRTIMSRGFSIDPERREVRIRGNLVDLTRQEFDVLHMLVNHPGIVFSRQALLTRVWSGDAFVTDRTVDSVVSRLRKKIEIDPQTPEFILTEWGVGYKFADLD
jgi:DNA-binding response OmpR family regulator